jgi:hypothetical protein
MKLYLRKTLGIPSESVSATLQLLVKLSLREQPREERRACWRGLVRSEEMLILDYMIVASVPHQ